MDNGESELAGPNDYPAISVHGWRVDDTSSFCIDVDGIIVTRIPYAIADKFPGLAQAMLKGAVDWASERNADLRQQTKK